MAVWTGDNGGVDGAGKNGKSINAFLERAFVRDRGTFTLSNLSLQG